MFKKMINYLKDPHLVAVIQEFFGVDIPKYNVDKIQENVLNSSQELTATKRNGIPRELRDNTNQNNFKNNNVNENEINLLNLTEINNYSSSSKINNQFWYYLFMFGTELGDETFYSAFIPFLFWNIDGIVGRKIVIIWAIVMAIGQVMKDVICWPRPACPPAVRLQNKWSQEYGMPSTHAMIGVAIPFSIILFTMNRYIYSIPAGITIAILWCMLVCISRLYLGMHTLLDVIAGILLAILLMTPLVPFINIADHYFVTNGWALAVIILITILTIVYYPKSDRWTPTRGDTTLVVGVAVGLYLGAYLNYKTGATHEPNDVPPYDIVYPTFEIFGKIILRSILGYCIIIIMKIICKILCYAIIGSILRVNWKELMNSEHSLENKNKVFVDLTYKYLLSFIGGIIIVYIMPIIYSTIGIDRPNFKWEM